MLGSTGDILQGSAATSDPRLLAAASSSSSSSAPFSCLALEIAGMKAEGEATAAAAVVAARYGDSSSLGGGGELMTPSARRRRAAAACGGRRCVVALSGAASCLGEGGVAGEGSDRVVARGSAQGNADDRDSYYRYCREEALVVLVVFSGSIGRCFVVYIVVHIPARRSIRVVRVMVVFYAHLRWLFDT